MGATSFLLLLASVLTNVAGQFFLKTGALKLNHVTGAGISRIIGMITIPELLIGLSCYGCGAIAYILLLSKVPLSIAGPSISLVYVCSVLMGALWFQEVVPISRLIGLSLIVCGVVLVMLQK